MRYYPPDIFPGIWRKIEVLIESGQLGASEEVLHELEKKDDDVHSWAKERSSMFLPTDELVQIHVARILTSHQRLVDTRKNRSSADPFVIALSQIHRCAVVTAEKPTTNLNSPRIPDVCADLGIQTVSLLELFRLESWIFQ